MYKICVIDIFAVFYIRETIVLANIAKIKRSRIKDGYRICKVFGFLAISVVKERWQHRIRLSRCYIKHMTTFGLLSIFHFQNIRLLSLLID